MSAPVFLSDRRLFLTRASWIVGGVAMAGMARVSLLQAAPAACYVNAGLYPDACGDWTVDHVCAAWPPYTYDIGPSRTPHHPVQSVDIDRHWVS